MPSAAQSPRRTVHPHAGGENSHLVPRVHVEHGSPPRGWGKLLRRRRHLLNHRFTPTRVGKTWASRCTGRAVARFTPTRVGKTLCNTPATDLAAVHPHAGGENEFGQCGRLGELRFTPTRVGKTRPALTSCPRSSVHPHAGGENGVSSPFPNRPSFGSPPRGWGKPCQRCLMPSIMAVHPHAGGENARQLSLFG